MSSPVAVSPVSTMGTPVPYITLAELKRSPVCNQLTKMRPHSTPADNDAELERMIVRVSSMINDEVNQNLAATLDNETGEVVVDRRGNINVHCRSNPIIQVQSVAFGRDVYNLQAVTDLTHLKLNPWSFTVPQGAGLFWRPGVRLEAEWTYINGFPVTTLVDAQSAGDTSVTVVDATGIIAGQTILTIEDGIYLEQVVPSVVVGNVLTVPALEFAHQAGVGIHSLPGSLKNVTLLLLSRVHDTWSLTMGAITSDGSGAKNKTAKPTIMCDAATILAPYQRKW